MPVLGAGSAPGQGAARTAVPRVSVVTTVWNGEQHIAETIDSVLKQTFADLELVIIDDGSTDGTCAVVESFRDPRIRLERRPHAGIVASANYGISVARGEYIARLDADDISLPTRIERQVAALDADPGAVLSYTDVRMFGENIFGDLTPGHQSPRLALSHALVSIQSCLRCPFIHSSAMYRRSAYDQIGGYLEKYPVSEDFSLFTRLLRVGGCAGVPLPLVRYRRHSGSATVQRQELMVQCTREICMEQMIYFLQIDEAKAAELYEKLVRPPGPKDRRAWIFFLSRVLRHPACWAPEPMAWLLSQSRNTRWKI